MTTTVLSLKIGCVRLIAPNSFIAEGGSVCYVSLSCLKALEKTPATPGPDQLPSSI
jgi:hypothetical protein